MADIKYIDLKDNDSVEYHIFPDLSKIPYEESVTFQYIDELMLSICNFIKKLSGNYIWHNEEFRITPKNLNSYLLSSSTEPFSFYGSMNYGENIEDEWFLVYLLVELTKEMDGVIVQIKDGDGEFLLIEAAEELPSWIVPETSEERTFLFKGELHVLPKDYKPNNDDYMITNSVLSYVRKNSELIKCDHSVQKAIKCRISGFYNHMEDRYHNAVLYVPVGVAALINANEKFVAPAVRAFYDRDLLDIKACRAMKYFPPENRVYTHVKFTKLLYVMMATSKYIPDKRTGWNLPQPNHHNYKSHLLGIKLACGFEILLNQSKHEKDSGNAKEFSFANDANWEKFLRSLRARNYFRGLLEHSKQYNELLEGAKEYYTNCCEKSPQPSKAKEILETMNKLEVDIDELKKKENMLPEPDDDSWMNISQQELDSLLEVRFGSRLENVKSEDISRHVNTFINHVSGIEGAEFPSDSKGLGNSLPNRTATKKRKAVKFSLDTKMSDASTEEVSTMSDNIKFEPEGFISAIQNILDFSIPDDNYWESEGSGMSSYDDETDTEIGESGKSKKDPELVEYMKQMDKELLNSTMGKSFINKTSEGKPRKEDKAEEVGLRSVDIDVNTYKNMISSYRAQMGEPGPAENLLGSLGVKLHNIEVETD